MQSIYTIHMNGADTAFHSLSEAVALIADLTLEDGEWDLTVAHQVVEAGHPLVRIANRNLGNLVA